VLCVHAKKPIQGQVEAIHNLSILYHIYGGQGGGEIFMECLVMSSLFFEDTSKLTYLIDMPIKQNIF
jgi:hypothetical protein